MNLREWQSLAHRAIRGETASGSAFLEPENLSAYVRGFRGRVRESLESDFPLLLRLVGREAFRARVDSWLREPRGYFIELRALAPELLRFLAERGEPASVLRAARIDLLAEEARIAPEEATGGRLFGLHPSVRLLCEGPRAYCIWRQEGSVCRERLRAEELRLLECFAERAELAEISERLERSGLEPGFVQGSVAVWSESGVIVSFAE